MKSNLSKSEAKEKISNFFKKEDFSPLNFKKIKRLAMKHRISLKPYKRRFCNNCFNPLKGKIRVSKTHKTVTCQLCNKPNKWKINSPNQQSDQQ
jgi:RNase P subunit RPR2